MMKILRILIMKNKRVSHTFGCIFLIVEDGGIYLNTGRNMEEYEEAILWIKSRIC